jgi:hypothetical protein
MVSVFQNSSPRQMSYVSVDEYSRQELIVTQTILLQYFKGIHSRMLKQSKDVIENEKNEGQPPT